jgi:hypothetical protein
LENGAADAESCGLKKNTQHENRNAWISGKAGFFNYTGYTDYTDSDSLMSQMNADFSGLFLFLISN